ncbi:hypothetical protein [Thermoactinomyces mirandus]|uniref:Uncharacterized protein n=1 Tax=Thermoactinomyces mirandus TaxID=2756294 RepID=A0A7W1XUB6_9BACL|nr:hypothetical protein [Thermoactinomyces mirandus]MBA4603414.1 hypothetical protein [Thermoactinomyces mirandus]
MPVNKTIVKAIYSLYFTTHSQVADRASITTSAILEQISVNQSQKAAAFSFVHFQAPEILSVVQSQAFENGSVIKSRNPSFSSTGGNETGCSFCTGTFCSNWSNLSLTVGTSKLLSA